MCVPLDTPFAAIVIEFALTMSMRCRNVAVQGVLLLLLELDLKLQYVKLVSRMFHRSQALELCAVVHKEA